MSDDYPEPVVIYDASPYGAPDEAAPNGGAIFWLVVVIAGLAFGLLIVGGLVQLALAVR